MLPTGRAVRVRRIFLGSAHPIPTDLEAVKVLSGAPAVLDLFMWLCYRCFVSRGQESIPLFGQYGLTTQLGSVEYSRPGASGRCWISGWEWFEQFGRNVRRRSVAMVSRWGLAMARPFCPRLKQQPATKMEFLEGSGWLDLSCEGCDTILVSESGKCQTAIMARLEININKLSPEERL